MSDTYENRPGGGLDVTDAGIYDSDEYGPPGTVPFAVPFAVPSDDPQAFPWGHVPPQQGTPLDVGEWGTAPADDGAAEVAADRERLARLAGFFRHRVFGGGPGGLAAELRNPQPETWRDHHRHITSHPVMPQNMWGAIAFAGAHYIYSGHMKTVGWALTRTGEALVFAGKRVEWTGDRAIRVTAVYAAIAIMIFLLTAFVIR